ncbi:hypothetical protein CEXT_155501 [Caerostris extrusa]|uniref:Uncharacterized protein n=1 Tax=Caerostris extrusa TaxID=172846 RepID=A0AAV4XBZ9_CAEEX|nr:hypothetical protein CEXT_155501 [Caerostris extrusa]
MTTILENFSLLSYKHPEESCIDDEESIPQYLCSERETRERGRREGRKRKKKKRKRSSEMESANFHEAFTSSERTSAPLTCIFHAPNEKLNVP